MRFANWLRESREAMKLSRLAFGKRIGVSESTIKNYENGVTLPEDDTLERIADLFKTPFIDLWAACHRKTHKRIVEILDRASEHDYHPDSISSPELKEVCDVLIEHPGLVRAVLDMLRFSVRHGGKNKKGGAFV